MNKQEQPRVMAYTLAKEIPHTQLEDVSGGAVTSQKETFQPSGGSVNNLDAVLDITIDW